MPPETKVPADLDDAALLAGFEQLTLPIESWTHRSHVRVASLYTSRFGFDQGLAKMRSGIQAYNKAKGVKDSKEGGYHETLTVAWLTVVAAALEVNPRPPASSLEFIRLNDHLLDKTLLRRHYSRERMLSDEAKARFVEPDLEPLPTLYMTRPSLAPRLPTRAAGG